MMNAFISTNYSKVKFSLFFLPLFLLLTIVLFLYSYDSLSVQNYINIQKDCFVFLNLKLSRFPNLEYNLTQFGDALIFLSFLSVFIIYAPKVWDSLLSGLLISPLFSCVLKKIFAVPRPSVVLDTKNFTIIGKTLSGCNSLPSGHSITVGAVLTVLFFAFMPRKVAYKVIWFFLIIFVAVILVLTRIGVGAHFPLDALIGVILGYISGIIGIFITRKYRLWGWMSNIKYYPLVILILTVCSICTICRIIDENLVVYYFSLMFLLISLYKITLAYAQK